MFIERCNFHSGSVRKSGQILKGQKAQWSSALSNGASAQGHAGVYKHFTTPDGVNESGRDAAECSRECAERI